MINKIRLLLLTIFTLFWVTSLAITNQELTAISNSISKNKKSTLNADLSNAYLTKDLEKAMYSTLR